MNTLRKILIGATSAAAVAGLATAASAQTAPNTSTASATITGNVIAPIAIENKEGMRFGTIIRPRTSASTVTLSPSEAVTTLAFTGTDAAGDKAMSVTSGNTPIGPGRFEVTGEGGKVYSITPTLSVTGTGVTAVAFDPAVDMLIDGATGSLTATLPATTGTKQIITTGARINVGANATGAIGGSLTLVVTYN